MAKNFLDVGFNQFLQREYVTTTSGQRNFLPEEDFNSLVEGVSGSKITSGVSRSSKGDLKINWDKSLLEFIDGLVSIVQIGRFDDGTKGVRINDDLGNNISLSALELKMGKPVTPGFVNTARLYVDNGGTGSKNRLMVQFVGGAAQKIASQP